MTDTRDINKTGPDYPWPPQAGSNALGVAQVGVSPLGNIPALYPETLILSQYANAPALNGIIYSFFAAADQTANFDAFYDNVFNIETCGSYGLDVWGRIVGINRVVHLAITEWFGFAESEPGTLSWNTNVNCIPALVLGFAEGLPSWSPFDVGVFGYAPGSISGVPYTWTENDVNQGGGAYYSGENLTMNYRLTDEAYRHCIMAKAAQNITDCSIPNINQILLNLFPNRGNAYVTDGYQGGFYFGFQESKNALTFGQGVFYNGETIPTMCMQYVFDFKLNPVEYAIVANSGVLPKPTGVLATVVQNY